MESDNTVARKRFAWFAWAVLAFNVPVILWGAYVRASYSGDGCGAHWPFCNGQLIPQNMPKPQVIEFTHRVTIGMDVLLTIALVVFAFWVYPKRHIVRRYAAATMVFLVVESALGAGLVLFRMVARDQSAGRGWYLSAHLVNTMLMLAAMTLTAWLAGGGTKRLTIGFKIRNALPSLLWAAAITIFVSITGAVTALGDTLFPAGTLMEGVRQDLAGGSPLLVRLRIAHPAIAVTGAVFILWTTLEFWRHTSEAGARKAAMWLVWLCGLQLFVGAANLSLLAPVYMQIVHLLVGDFAWIAMVLVIAESALISQRVPATTPMGLSPRQTAAGKPA